MYTFSRLLTPAMALLLILVGCNGVDDETNDVVEDPAFTEEAAPEDARVAVANLQPTEGNDVTGHVTFSEEPAGIRVVADVSGLTGERHGFHVHEFGDCSAPDSDSAGGHFAPHDDPHGGPDDPPGQRHVGDLGNIDVLEGELGYYERIDDVISFDGQESIIGKAVIVHAEADDLESQPTGDAGARLACGVIELQNGQAQPGAMDNLPNGADAEDNL